MKFLPITEFEKRQKSINSNQTRAIMNAMMTKVEVFIDALSSPSDWLLKLNHPLKPSKDTRGHREKEKSNQAEGNGKQCFQKAGLRKC